MNLIKLITATFILIIIQACSSGPEPIHFGKDGCAWCKMTIIDPKFGSELVTDKGKIFKFDDVNCLVSYMQENGYKASENLQLLVVDYDQKEVLIDAASAYFVKSDNIKSPMASRIAAFKSKTIQEEYQSKWNGESLSWTDIVQLFSEE